MKNEITDFIINTLVEKYYVSSDLINGNSVYDELALDSLVLLEITAMIEKKFNVNIPIGVITSEMTIAKSAANILRKAA